MSCFGLFPDESASRILFQPDTTIGEPDHKASVPPCGLLGVDEMALNRRAP